MIFIDAVEVNPVKFDEILSYGHSGEHQIVGEGGRER